MRGGRQPAARIAAIASSARWITVEYQRDRGLGLTVYFGKRKGGSASTGDLKKAAWRVTWAEKPAPSHATPPKMNVGPGRTPKTSARAAVPDLDLYRKRDREPDQAVELARGREAAGTGRGLAAHELRRRLGGKLSAAFGSTVTRTASWRASRAALHQLRAARQPGRGRHSSATSGTPRPATRGIWRMRRAIGRRAGGERGRAPGCVATKSASGAR